MTAMLAGKAALITGGGGGIGSAAALVFARHGARVVVADLDLTAAEAAAEAVRRAGGEATAIAADLTIEAEVARMVDQAVAAYGRLDCAFNNAGVANPPTPVQELTLEHWRPALNVDLLGVWLCVKYELAAMTRTGGGVIVNNASNAGLAAVPTLAPYGAAKAGVINFTKTVAVECAGLGIRANAICPGVIETAPIRAMKAQGIDYAAQLNIPLKRAGQPEEVGELAAWLASPWSSFVTGQAISIDGGQTACQ